MQLVAQTSLCITALEAKHGVERRQFIICGDVYRIAELREEARDLWKPVPPCFKPRGGGLSERIKGSFDGVPVALVYGLPGLSIMLGVDIVGGVSWTDPGFMSWETVDGTQTKVHPQAIV